jgi:hypothetical protein
LKSATSTVKTYIQALEPTRARAVRTACDAILASSPGVVETMDHGMPFFTLAGEPYIAVASQKHYVSLYVVRLDETFAADPTLASAFEGLNRGKNCLRYRDSQLGRLDGNEVRRLVEATYRACQPVG